MTRTQATLPARVGSYDIDILFQGFPGKATHHGGLGWSTVVLLRGHGRTILLDTGSFGQRVPLKQRLQAQGVEPSDVTDLLLSHAHWDHIVNFPLFGSAQIHIGRTEMEWALSAEIGTFALPELYVAGLAAHPRLNLVEEGMEVLPDIHVVAGPGHSPGHLIFVLEGAERTVIFAQDAAKSRAEIVSRTADLTIDTKLSTETLDRVWDLWKRRKDTILVPGHDLPMMLEGEKLQALGHRQAGVRATFGDSLDDETEFHFG